MGLFGKITLIGFGYFFPTNVIAQVAIEDRSHLWPESAPQLYSGILSAASGVVMFLLIVFGFILFLIMRKTKSKAVIIPYSALFIGFLAYLFADTFASVDEFLRLCETKAGFHGQVIPPGSGVVVSENLYMGCGLNCKAALRYDGNVSFVEGHATKINFASGHKGILYAPGFYRVTKQDGSSPFCQGVSPDQINNAPISIYPLPTEHCFHLERVSYLSADYSVRPVYLGEFISAKNIRGQLTEIKNNKTDNILATDGTFNFRLGRIDRLNFSRIGMGGVVIANCWDTSGSFIKMWGIKNLVLNN